MTKINVPSNSIGIEMRDGTKYNSRKGKIEVRDPMHLKEIAGSKTQHNDHVGATAVPVSFAGGEERLCRCGRAAFNWETACPRCGTLLATEMAEGVGG